MASSATVPLVEVRLHGDLKEKFGSVFHLAVRTPAEAIRALASNTRGFQAEFIKSPFYSVLVNGEQIALEEIGMQRTLRTIDFVPSVAGGKSEVGGIILFAAAMFLTAGAIGLLAMPAGATTGFLGLGWAGVGAAGGWGMVAGGFFSLGMSALFMGIAMELQPDSPNANEAEAPENRPSKLFSGAVNTAASGRPCPVCYGELGVGSHVISAGLYTEDSLND